eukprot:TRINITY_DN719_c0_g1_i1.p1 TRINITY_DN719_c0_g1~~TRINITY_DN719_c0_g1_i1.p1  ORF type:complete len:324 (+),score=-41.84 TRINITY_DN719_c0_g1_i1:56-973(+)
MKTINTIKGLLQYQKVHKTFKQYYQINWQSNTQSSVTALRQLSNAEGHTEDSMRVGFSQCIFNYLCPFTANIIIPQQVLAKTITQIQINEPIIRLQCNSNSLCSFISNIIIPQKFKRHIEYQDLKKQLQCFLSTLFQLLLLLHLQFHFSLEIAYKIVQRVNSISVWFFCSAAPIILAPSLPTLLPPNKYVVKQEIPRLSLVSVLLISNAFAIAFIPSQPMLLPAIMWRLQERVLRSSTSSAVFFFNASPIIFAPSSPILFCATIRKGVLIQEITEYQLIKAVVILQYNSYNLYSLIANIDFPCQL